MNDSAPVIHIPVYAPYLSGREREYVNQCLDSKWISSKGEFVTRFENEFASYIHAGSATAVCNGTVALHLALLALGIKPGDEVIVPTFTYIASVNAIAFVGATPVFAESDPDSWNIDPDKIIGKISPKTRAILVVHLYGAPCNMEKITAICKTHHLLLVEDVAEAFGSKYNGQFLGTFGDISTFSFFGNKTITTGEGGMVASNQTAIIERVAYLKAQAVSPAREYWHDEIGYNYRMTNICAAIGVAQLEQANWIIQRKREIAGLYKFELTGFPVTFQVDLDNAFNTFWMISILAQTPELCMGIRTTLKNQGIETRPFFYPAHKMPTFECSESFPVAESISARGLNLPSYPDLQDHEIQRICDIIKNYLNG